MNTQEFYKWLKGEPSLCTEDQAYEMLVFLATFKTNGVKINVIDNLLRDRIIPVLKSSENVEDVEEIKELLEVVGYLKGTGFPSKQKPPAQLQIRLTAYKTVLSERLAQIQTPILSKLPRALEKEPVTEEDTKPPKTTARSRARLLKDKVRPNSMKNFSSTTLGYPFPRGELAITDEDGED